MRAPRLLTRADDTRVAGVAGRVILARGTPEHLAKLFWPPTSGRRCEEPAHSDVFAQPVTLPQCATEYIISLTALVAAREFRDVLVEPSKYFATRGSLVLVAEVHTVARQGGRARGELAAALAILVVVGCGAQEARARLEQHV